VGLEYVQGNVLKSDASIIAHGVNCRGGFGSGVAGQIAKSYPEVKRAYLRWFEQGKWKPGEVQVVMADDKRLFANMATQDTYGAKGKHVIETAVKQCLDTLLTMAAKEGYTVAMPKIGSGLGGGDWDEIEPILEEVVERTGASVEVYSLE
jgi:O-acetyl-ADP-ribose deacetylase (regulator of RNase III)